MVAILDLLQEWDTDILLLLNGCHSDALDPVMYTLTGKFIWVPFYLILATIVVRRLGWRKAILSFLLIAMTIAIADQICSSIIRPLAMRLRPSNIENPLSRYIHIVNDYRGGRYGMASCHAANCFALAVYLIRSLRLKLVPALLLATWAAIVVYTRIYLGVHYPGDIVVGGLIGVATAYASSELYLHLVHRTQHWQRLTAGIPVLWQRIIRLP